MDNPDLDAIESCCTAILHRQDDPEVDALMRLVVNSVPALIAEVRAARAIIEAYRAWSIFQHMSSMDSVNSLLAAYDTLRAEQVRD